MSCYSHSIVAGFVLVGRNGSVGSPAATRPSAPVSPRVRERSDFIRVGTRRMGRAGTKTPCGVRIMSDNVRRWIPERGSRESYTEAETERT